MVIAEFTNTFFLISNFIFWLTLDLLSKFTFLRFKVAKELLGNFQNFKQFLAIFLLLPVSAANVRETVVEKFSYSELKIEKLKLFTQSSTKIICSSVF